MRKLLKNHKGVTMIEVLVTVAILAIVVVPCLSAFVMAQRGNVKAKETFETYTAAANLMESWKSDSNDEYFEQLTNENGSYRVYIDEKNITAVCDPPQVGDRHYTITLYTGDWSDNLQELPSEYLIKGVVAQ